MDKTAEDVPNAHLFQRQPRWTAVPGSGEARGLLGRGQVHRRGGQRATGRLVTWLLSSVLVVAAVVVPVGCSPADAPQDAPEDTPTTKQTIDVALEASTIRLTGTVGRPVQTHHMLLDCSSAESLVWRASDDALWLDVSPSSGTFDCGVAEIAITASPGDLAAGSYTATITITVDGYPDASATAVAELVLEPAPDPEMEAARAFWESSTFRSYWQMKAASDVRSVVMEYGFPEYDLGEPDDISVSEIEFDFVPEEFERPISRVHCVVNFIVWDKPTGREVEKSYKYGTRYYTDTLVILEVAPGPFSKTKNDWVVLVVGNYPG
jgi:hypothetical protein